VVPGLPAIYLLEPSVGNFKMIASDCQKNIYDFVFVNFTRKLSESDLETFAIEMTKSNASHKICRVSYDHLGAYHVISKDFFSLFNHQDNFVNLYQSKNEALIIETLANNLFEVFCSLGLAPMVRVDSREVNPVNQKIIERMT